jgi:hypothetical protein
MRPASQTRSPAPDAERLADAAWWIAGGWAIETFTGVHRDTTVIEDVERAMWVADDGLTYLRPEVALASKAALARPKDTADLDAGLPLLEHDAEAWLADVLQRAHPAHPWLGRLRWPSRRGHPHWGITAADRRPDG